ncbi:MAG: hypothetical protein SV186_03510 [Candidatus Nanohaloarchaea archaeon]|nr:hypothetical protein [Candidatus Nanohaloarchaea archaeon]
MDTGHIRQQARKLGVWFRDRPAVTAMFAGSTLLMLWLHAQGWNWDFMVYSMNAGYLFHGGSYIEWYRPPVAATIIGLLRFIVPRRPAEFIYIVLVSTFLLHTTKQVAERYEIDLTKLYLLLLSPFIILHGTLNGTEMLGLAFAMLFIADLSRPRAGLWLGLAFLTRYTYVFLLPLVLFQRWPKKIVATYLISAVPVAAWFGHNWLVLGDPFASIANSVALNVRLRHISNPFNPVHIVLITGLSGLFIAAALVRRKASWKQPNATTTAMIAFAGLTILSYARTPVKPVRYLYPLAFPAAFFAAEAWDRLSVAQGIVTVVLAVNLLGAGVLVSGQYMADPAPYRRAAAATDDCMTASNLWPHMSYAGQVSTPAHDLERTKQQIRNGERIVLFRNVETPPFITNETVLESLPAVERTPVYVILGNSSLCREPTRYNTTYFERREKKYASDGIQKSYDPCHFLFGKICSFVGL